jgi:hypothetical protein
MSRTDRNHVTNLEGGGRCCRVYQPQQQEGVEAGSKLIWLANVKRQNLGEGALRNGENGH